MTDKWQRTRSERHRAKVRGQIIKGSMLRVLCCMLFVLSLLLPSPLLAKITGVCSNCHTMHNSQNSAAMSFDGTTHEYLLRGDCIGCHAQNTSQNINPNGNIPQVLHTNATDLAAGNFRYYLDSQTNVHNVYGITPQDNVLLNNPPGYLSGYDPANPIFDTNSRLVCAGRNGCHGNRDQVGQLAAIKGAHHYNDSMLKFGSIDEANQGGGSGGTSDYTTTGKSYRFLYNVQGAEESSWLNESSTKHNEYKGALFATRTSQSWGNINTISELCAECHGNYHASGSGYIGSASPWLRHPTDKRLGPSSGEYANYTTYDVMAPVGRVDSLNTYTAPKSTVAAGANDVIICLSCHKAHGSPYFKIMKWDYKGLDLSTALSGCNVCHTSKINPYLNSSAHGNTSYGVNRTGLSTFGYSIGNCVHCHEQHASINGAEPFPNTGNASGPERFLLFDQKHTSQTVTFCFDCHTSAGSYQTGGISINRSYSYNFGGNTTFGTYDSDILSAFSHTASGSSHWLSDIQSFAFGQPHKTASNVVWTLDADLHPCDACHNPHRSRRNYNTPYDASKSAIVRPSAHNTIWGDANGERMNNYTYKSPYWSNITSYEPANDLTSNGSNQPDYAAFSTDCHNRNNPITTSNPQWKGSSTP